MGFIWGGAEGRKGNEREKELGGVGVMGSRQD